MLTSTAIDESLLEIAFAKLGLTALLLSVNNSTAAVAHLVKQTKSSHLVYGEKFQQTAEEAHRQLKEEGYEVKLVAERRFPIWGEGGIDEWKGEVVPARLSPEVESKRTCVILHSSGSVSLSQVNVSHKAHVYLQLDWFPETCLHHSLRFGEHGYCKSPVFHFTNPIVLLQQIANVCVIRLFRQPCS